MPAHKRPLPPPSTAFGDSFLPPPPPDSHHPQQQQQQQEDEKEEEEEENGLQRAEEPQREEEDDAEEEEYDETMDADGDQDEDDLQHQHQENLQSGMAQERQEEQYEDGDEEGGGGGCQKEPEDEYDYDEDEAITDDERLMPVTLMDIRKDVQCSICLGIIRKTRAVMDCLHRFCRECIDKSMRLGNNECPACRTHCASRRSLRDDSNYDSLISVVYADIDKYEEEELAFREEEHSRNKMIQAAIAETYRRQTEALCRRRPTAKATAAAFIRKSQGNYRSHGQNGYFRGRGRNSGHEAALATSDDEDELETNATYGSKESSSAEEPSPDGRHKRCKIWAPPRSSPARATTGNVDLGCVDNTEPEVSRENIRTSPLQAGEMLAWGKNGTRSQTRHGSTSGSNGRMIKGGHMTRLVDHLRNLNETNDQLYVHVTLVPLDEETMPNLQQRYICCQPTVSIRQLREFIALQMFVQAEDVLLFARKPQVQTAEVKPLSTTNVTPLVFVHALNSQQSMHTLLDSFSADQGELVLTYCLESDWNSKAKVSPSCS